MPALLTTSSVVMYPHAGTVSASSSNSKAKAGNFIGRPSDTFIIAGDPFTLANGTPHPCMTVQWVRSTLRCKAPGDLALAQDSIGMCLAADETPQGSVRIQSTQTRVTGV